jgi:hypothetical protein
VFSQTGYSKDLDALMRARERIDPAQRQQLLDLLNGGTDRRRDHDELNCSNWQLKVADMSEWVGQIAVCPLAF